MLLRYLTVRPQTSEEIFDMVFIFNEIWLWGSALTDTSISAALVMSLYKHKRSLLASTNRRSTETLLEKVCRVYPGECHAVLST